MLALCFMGLQIASFSIEPAKRMLFTYTITFSAGHTQASCFGVGEECSLLCGGMPCPCHIPCWGAGSACTHTVTIGLTPAMDEGEFDGVFDTEQDGFNGEVLNMPSRSGPIIHGGQNKYLNIPEQKVFIANYDPGAPPHLYNLSHITITDSPLFEVYSAPPTED
jgi:hypothetical protein